MARFASFFVALFVLVSALYVSAAPNVAVSYHKKMRKMRKGGAVEAAGNGTAVVKPPSFKCSIARVSIVEGLKLTTDAVNGIDAGGDQQVDDGLQTAKDGLASAQDAVNVILQAIQDGQAPPAEARTQVADGLNKAGVALLGVGNSTTGVSDAIDELDATGGFGNDVLANC